MIKPIYRKCSQSRFLQDCIARSEEILQEPECIYPNGRQSHEVARETIDQCETDLITFICIEVTPRG